ncbi:MAG: hypothetical protein ACOCSQ_01460 [Planctomycetota bacterium]
MKVFVEGDDFLRALDDKVAGVVVTGDTATSRKNAALWLARYAERQDCDVELVFGAPSTGEVLPPYEQHGRVKMRNLEADEECARWVAGPANRMAERDRVYVVSDTPRVCRAAEGSEARVFGSEEFIDRARRVMGQDDDTARYDEPDEKYSGLAEEEADFWIEFFKNDG